MSESPPSDWGASMMVRIFEGTAELERDGTVEGPLLWTCEFFAARLALVGTGADIDIVGNFGSVTCLSMASARGDSLSPIQVRVNHRPPAMPLISRLTGRQCLGLAPVRSRGTTGANPVLIFRGI